MLNGVDFFAGIGGVSSGWKQSGIINPLLSLEYNSAFPGLSSAYQCSHSVNFPDGKFIKLLIQKWVELGFPGLAKNEVFIAHGSPPCQNFSQATRGMSNRPIENELDLVCANAYADFLGEFLPSYFTLEQVPDYQKSESFESFYKRVCLFYNVRIYRINLMHFGIPQDRVRLFVVGNRFHKAALELPPYKQHNGWFSTLQGLKLQSTTLTQKQSRIAQVKGHKTLLLPRVGKCDFRTAKLHYEPFPTLLRAYFTDQNNSNRYEPFSCLVDGFPYRVPIRALARAQGFFDDFVLPLQPAIAGSGIGNAFSPQFICDFITHNFKK